MRRRRKMVRILVVACTIYGAWMLLGRSANEVIVIQMGNRVVGEYQARLWVVDQGKFSWIRAERPDRYWLDPLRDDPEIVVLRDGEIVDYRARFFPAPDVQREIHGLFREKYRTADLAREWSRHWTREWLPADEMIAIRLERI